MKRYRQYFMVFAAGVAFATSLLSERYMIFNYLILIGAPAMVVITYMLFQSFKK